MQYPGFLGIKALWTQFPLGSDTSTSADIKNPKWILRLFLWFPSSITKTHIQTCIWISDSSPGLHARAPRLLFGFLASATLDPAVLGRGRRRLSTQTIIYGSENGILGGYSKSTNVNRLFYGLSWRNFLNQVNWRCITLSRVHTTGPQMSSRAATGRKQNFL